MLNTLYIIITIMCTNVSKHEQILSTSNRWIRLKNMCAMQIPLKIENKNCLKIPILSAEPNFKSLTKERNENQRQVFHEQ